MFDKISLIQETNQFKNNKIDNLMKKLISEISEVFTGVPVKHFKKTETLGGFQVDLITADCLSRDGVIDLKKTTKRWADGLFASKFFLQKGDILVQMRGSAFKASIVENAPDKREILVNSNTSIIRLNTDQVLPEVICFYLNSEYFLQNTIKKTQSNTILINLKALALVALDIPDMKTQEHLKGLYKAKLKLKTATLDLLAQQESVTETRFLELMKQTEE